MKRCDLCYMCFNRYLDSTRRRQTNGSRTRLTGPIIKDGGGQTGGRGEQIGLKGGMKEGRRGRQRQGGEERQAAERDG